MYIVLKTEHGETVATEYTVATIIRKEIGVSIKPVCVFAKSFEHKNDALEMDWLEITLDHSQLINEKGEGCFVEILEMVPDMRKYL